MRAKDDRFYEQFVRFSLGPERELYDLIQENIAGRDGTILPIEDRMMKSIHDVCMASGVKIEDVDRKVGDWGGGLRERLKAISKERIYASVQRIPSHAVHGTWVDLYKNHLEYMEKNQVYAPQPQQGWVDARLLGPTAIFVLDSVKPYIEKYFAHMQNFSIVEERLEDLRQRLFRAEEKHERLFAKR